MEIFLGLWSSWFFLVLFMVVLVSPDQQSFLKASVITIVIAPLIWVLSGISGYWTVVIFNRFTGLGFSIAGNPIGNRHIINQVVMGVPLLFAVF